MRIVLLALFFVSALHASITQMFPWCMTGTTLQPCVAGVNVTVGSTIINQSAIAVPSAPVVTPTCSGTCATTYSYSIAAVNALGNTLFSSSGSTAAQAASLDGTHFNTISFPSGTYVISRDSGGSGQGIIGVTTGTSFVDSGLPTNFNGSNSIETTAGDLFPSMISRLNAQPSGPLHILAGCTTTANNTSAIVGSAGCHFTRDLRLADVVYLSSDLSNGQNVYGIADDTHITVISGFGGGNTPMGDGTTQNLIVQPSSIYFPIGPDATWGKYFWVIDGVGNPTFANYTPGFGIIFDHVAASDNQTVGLEDAYAMVNTSLASNQIRNVGNIAVRGKLANDATITAEWRVETAANGRLFGVNLVSGDIKVGSGAGLSGISSAVTVKGSDGNNCTITFTHGIATASTCP